ncbi:HNH endonuclease signature motif containing protein [Metabacillus fastidiosus]|uniref:HNH endonuclease signature motif containing protein n=1 Tax=Metabacillus fastidiosus TaxID=1458 RepID=A0ABU6NZ53_9BACI|nr:HNH endonuclease signature motif containing protein [Metabacillus fastidiosus]MED4402396.1 HNH endonuclease signature motif containing protein [Metabacillus fastidiosus]MED4462268.1 HNH endonuclease signature motif containing protein [Metabacillus fastidiosus]
MTMTRPLAINEVVNNQQLCEVFLCAPQGGMRKSNRTNTLTLISDKTKLYDDKVVDDIYHYTGMGQSGDQKMSGQNLTLAESDGNGVEIHFFEVMKPREYTYRGQVELAGEPYQGQQKDQDGRQRLVWIFPLRLMDNKAKFTKPPSATNDKQELKEEFKGIQQVENLPITQTEKERLIKARIGQGKFKKLLIERECKCALCGVTDPRVLIASHIKPWSASTNEERLDVNNGLLLCPNHDALFDKQLISFDVQGKIVISQTLDEAARIFMNVNEGLRVELTEKQLGYMEYHHQNLI